MARLFLAFAILVFGTTSLRSADPPKAEEPAKPVASNAKLVVRDVNLYVMSSYGNALNHRDLFRSTLPGFVGTSRPMADRKHVNNPSPAGLITFEGEPNDNVDVLLEFTNGKFFGRWPPCPQKNKRLLWVKAKLTKESGEPVSTLPEDHWMTFLRNSDRLWFESGRRSEKFILYDAELPLPAPVKVTLVDGGHGLANLAKYPLHDVTVYKPEGDKWLVGILPLLEPPPKKEEKPDDKQDKDKKKPDPEAIFDKDPKDKPADAKPAEEKKEGKKDEPKTEPAKDKEAESATTEAAAAPATAAATPAAAPGAAPATTPDGKPMPPGAKPADGEKKPDDAKVVSVLSSKEPQDKEAITAAWAPRLKELGLGPVEIEHLSKQIAGQALRSDSATIVFRLSEDHLEELFPLEVTPAPQKQIRVALVVLLDSDPDVTRRVEELVKKLGDPSYAEREKAMEALRKLGPAAKQKVQEAVNDKDAEIAFRAEQLAEELNDPAGAQLQPNPGS